MNCGTYRLVHNIAFLITSLLYLRGAGEQPLMLYMLILDVVDKRRSGKIGYVDQTPHSNACAQCFMVFSSITIPATRFQAYWSDKRPGVVGGSAMRCYVRGNHGAYLG
jgi:hypothetical protein